MLRATRIYLTALLALCAGGAYAQKTPQPAALPKPHKVFIPQTYLGDSELKGGAIKKDDFARLVRKGIYARDSAGNRYKVKGFEFIYGERQLYEDSIGNMMVMFDYLSEYCPGDTLSVGVSGSIYEKLKVGDTAYFNQVEVLRPRPGEETGNVVIGRGMKFAITK